MFVLGNILYQAASAAAASGGNYGDSYDPSYGVTQAPVGYGPQMSHSARMLGYGFPATSGGYDTSHSYGIHELPDLWIITLIKY